MLSQPVDSAFIHGLCARMRRIQAEGEGVVFKPEICVAEFEVTITGGMCERSDRRQAWRRS